MISSMMDDKTIRVPNALGKKSLAAHANRNTRSFAWGDDFHYRALFEQSDDCIFIISFDLCYLAANPRALKLLGYTASEMVGKPVSEIMALDESHGHDAALDDSLNLSERILQRKDGTTVPVEINTSIVYNKIGSPAYIQSIARDISKRKEVELAINSSEARNRSIIEALPDLIIRMDSWGKVLDYSVRPDHPLYLSLGEVTGKLLSEIWPEDIVNQIMGSNTHQEFKEAHHLREV